MSVLEHVLGELRSEEFKLEVDHVAPLEGMLQLFRFIHDHFGAHPELIALLSGENLLRARDECKRAANKEQRVRISAVWLQHSFVDTAATARPIAASVIARDGLPQPNATCPGH